MQATSRPAEPASKLYFESLPGYFLAVSPQLIILAASKSYQIASGYSKEDLIGLPISVLCERFHPGAVAEHLLRWQESLDYMVRHQAPHSMEVQCLNLSSGAEKSTKQFWLPRNTPVLAEDGQLEYFMHEVRDITTEYLTGREARQNKERFDLVALATNDAIWDWDIQNNSISWNEGYKSLFGFTEIDPTINSWFGFIHPEDRERVVQGIQAVIDSGAKFWSDEYRFRCADGSFSVIMDRGYVQYNEAGEATRMVGSMQDITLQRKTEQQLKDTSDFFRFLADTVPAFIWTSEPDGFTDYRNQYYYEFVGLENTQKPGFSWTDPLHPDDREASLNQWLHAVNTGELFEIEHRLKSKKGEYRWILSRSRPMRNEKGQIIKWFGTSTDIHDQKQYQQQLLDQDEQLQQMLHEAPIQLCILKGPSQLITYQNRAFSAAVNNISFVGQNAREAWPEINSQEFITHIEKVYKTGIPFKADEQLGYYTGRDGQIKAGYFNLNYQPLRNSNHEIEGVLCFSVDITEQIIARQQAERLARELQIETEKSKFFTEAIPQLVWSAQPDGSTDYFNQNWCLYTGRNLAESLKWGWKEVIHPDDLERTLTTWNYSVNTGAPYEIKYRLRGINGQYRWFLGRGMPMRDETGKIIKWFGTCTDIHEQNLIQQQLEESTARFRFLAEAMPQKVWTAKPNGDIDYYNQQWLQYTGMRFDDIKNWDWNKIIHPEDLHHTTTSWQQSLSTGTPLQMENRLRRSDGAYRWHLTRGLPMHNEQGLITMWVGTNTDIHENKVAQENLQLTNTELKKINEDLDRFVYTASHDLKSPIINIGSLFQEIMHSAHFTDPDHEKMVQMFHNSLNQINNTITDLGEIAKVQKNEQSDIEEVDLQSLIDEITFSVQELIKSNQGRISTDFTGKSTLRFSRANLRSILYNLVSNGLKYRSPERQPLVYISTLTEGDYVILSVQDNGLGIDLDRHRDKLFQMFKRFHNHVPGTGLGLYIINRIMENNNGFVRVESNLNQGTTFRIYFRLRYK